MKATAIKATLALAALTAALAPQSSFACAACFGDPNSTQTQSANLFLGILMAITWSVLGCLIAFMLYLRRKSREMERKLAEWEEVIEDKADLPLAKRFEWSDGAFTTLSTENSSRRRASKKHGAPRRRFNFPD